MRAATRMEPGRIPHSSKGQTICPKGQTICHREIPDPAITAVLDRETILHRNGMLYDVRR